MAKQLNVSLAVTANTGQAKQQLEQLQQKLQNLTMTSSNLKIGLDAGEIQKASQAVLELSGHLKAATNANTGILDFTKLTSSIKSSGTTLQEYSQQLLKLGPQGKQAFNELASSVAKSEIPIKRLSGLLGEFGTVLKNTIRWQISSSLIHGFMGSIQQAYGYAQDLNKSLNKIQIVTGLSDNQMAKFAQSANTAAKALSTTTTKYTDAALIYYQQGIRDEKEIAERTNTTIKLANVTGQSAETVSNQMTAIWNNFAKGGENLEYYADVITALGAATASSSDEIAQGLQKFAAVADTVGLSYENATAALATITATTRQSADTVGTGLRTLFSRLQSLSLGETLEDGVNLTKYSKALATVGVNALDAQGQLRAMDDVLSDLGEKWQTLSDAQQTALAQTVGGVRQYTTLMALMENFDFYKENLSVAQNAEGTLERQQAIYEKSWEAASKRVRASAESIYSDLIDDEFFTKLTDGFSKFLDIINNVITGLGGVKGVLMSLGGVLTATFSDQIAGGLYKFGVGVRDLFTSPKALAKQRETFITDAASIAIGKKVSIGADGKPDLNDLTTAEKQTFNATWNQLGIQRDYAANSKYMTPAQQEIALRAMDQATNAQQSYINAQNTAINSKFAALNARNELQGTAKLYGSETLYGTLSGGKTSQESIDAIKAFTNRFDQGANGLSGVTADFFDKNGKLRADILTASGELDKQKFEEKYSGYLKTAVDNYQKTAQEITKDKSAYEKFLRGEVDNYQGKTGSEAEDLYRANQADLTAASKKQSAFLSENFGINPALVAAYAAKEGKSIEDAATELAEKQMAEDAKKRAEIAAKQKSPGIVAADTVAHLGSGIMSAQAATAGIDSLLNVINGVNDGLLSTKDAATQGLSAVASMAMNGARTFSQFSQALGPVGGAIATIASIGLPYLIDMFDNMYETDSEKMERLNNQVELAQQDLSTARQEYNDIFTDFSGYSKALSGIQSMTVGTREFKEAVREANEEAQALIEKYNLSESDYYTDRNGAIHFKAGIEDELATAQEATIAEKERQVDIAEFNRDLNKLRSDRNSLDAAKNRAAAAYDALHTTVGSGGSQYTGNAADQAAYVREHIGDYIDKSLATTYGYKDTEDIVNAYFNDTAGLNAKMQAQSGVLKQYSNVLESQAKVDDGKISDLEQLSNTVLENQFDALDQTKYSLQKGVDSWSGATKEYVEYKTENGTVERINVGDANNRKVNTERRERVYKAQLQAIYGEKEGLEKYNQLIESQGYQGLTQKQKQEKLNGLLEQEELGKIVAEAAKTNAETLKNTVDVTKYEGYKSQKGSELFGKATILNGVRQNANGEWYSQYGAVGEEMSARLNAEKALMEAVAQQWGQSASDLHQVLLAQTNLNVSQKDIMDLASDFSMEDLDTLSTYTNMFGQMFGKDTASYIFAELTTEMKSGGSDLLNALDSINWSDSKIDNLFSLKTAIDNVDKNQPELKEKLTNTANVIYREIGGSAGLLEELYGSEGFASTLESLKESFETTGEISADAILSASKNCKTLDKFLEIADVNAQGLADIFEELQIGDIGINEVTDGLLRALSTAGELESNLSKVYNFIDNFSLDRSISDIGKFYKGLSDQVESSQKNGMLLDAPLLQSWGALFGQDSVKEYKDWAKAITGQAANEKWGKTEGNWTPEQISENFNEQFGAQIAAMQSIQERGNLSGMFEYAFNKNFEGGQVRETIKGVETDLMHFDETTGQVVADNDDAFQTMFAHQSDFIDYLANNLGIPQEMAEAMAAEFATTDAWAHDAWGQEAAQAGWDELIATVQNGTDLTANQLRAFYNQYSEFFDDTSFEEFAIRFRTATKDMGGSLIDLGKDFDYANATYDDLKAAMSDQEGEGGLDAYLAKNTKNYALNREGNIAEFAFGKLKNVTELQQAYMKLGFTAAQANALINESGQELVGTYHDVDKGLVTFAQDNKDYMDWVGKNYGKDQKSTADTMLAYQDYKNNEAQTKASADIYAAAFAEAMTGVKVEFTDGNLAQVIQDAQELANTHPVTIPTKWGKPGRLPNGTGEASGYNNASFAGGKHSNGQYEGLAEVGELGPELWIHDGEPYLAGVHGRTKAYIHPNDQIYTAAQTKEILRNNPSLQDIPGFSVGYNQVTWGSKSNANADNAKTSKWEPERYHLITRQIKDLQREYDRLNKIREKTFGTDKLKALDQEIEATNELIEGQKRLIQEAEDYLKLDTERVIKLLAPGEFQVDANGNLANFEELQQKYRKKAEEDKDEDAQTIWKALMQYEETIDKVHDSQTELQELIYQLQDLALEQITIKVELELDISEDRFEYLDYLLDKIDDDAFQAAEAIALLGDETAETMKKINNITMGLQEILAQNGLTLEDIDNMSADELKGAGFTQDQIEQIQEWRSELLKANSALLEMRKTIIEKVINAFNDLNDKVQKSYDNFDKYNSILEKYKNITDLIGKNISTQSRNIINQLNNSMLNNAKNTVKAARKIYEDAQLANAEAQAAYQIAVASGDAEAIRRWQEVINATSEKMQEANEQWLDAWQNTLEQAKAVFEQAMKDIQKNYNTTMSVTFGSLDYLQAAYDRQKEIDKQYIPDFDRLYELSKLSRNISAAIDDTDNIKGKQKLRELQKEINKLQANGVRLSEYDVKVLEKKFELEQARLALDDAHNAKSQVRLQRDANGNWGYVYTANEDEIAKAEQEYEDKLHEYQVLNAEYLEKLQDEALQVQQTWAETVGQIKSDLGLGLITEEEATARLEEMNKWLEEQQNYFYEQSNHALDNQASLYNRTLETYQVANANIVDAWDETNLSLMTKIHNFQDYMAKWQEAVQTFLTESDAAITQHSSNINSIDELAGVSTHTFENHIDQVIVDIANMSDDTVDNISNLSDVMAGEFASALMNAVNWELQYVDAMDKMITRNEQFVKSLNLMIEKLAGVNTETTQMLEPLETLSNIIEQSTTPVYYMNNLQELTNLSTERILALLDANTLAYSGGLGQLSNPIINGLSTAIDQNVTITASFPNATNHSEIEEAFTNLINKASQYANRKGL